jgi:hypothetical protein
MGQHSALREKHGAFVQTDSLCPLLFMIPFMQTTDHALHWAMINVSFFNSECPAVRAQSVKKNFGKNNHKNHTHITHAYKKTRLCFISIDVSP